jgi:hypothetical protein
MAQIDSMLVSIEQDTQNANQVKDLILERLLKDNLITDAIAEQYATDWQVIILIQIGLLDGVINSNLKKIHINIDMLDSSELLILHSY